jgi:hypothetical protein
MEQSIETTLRELIYQALTNTNEAAKEAAMEAAIHLSSTMTEAEVVRVTDSVTASLA